MGDKREKNRLGIEHGFISFVVLIVFVVGDRKLSQAGYQCIFLEAPHILPMTSMVYIEGQRVEIENGKRENARAWFLYSDTDPSDATRAQSGEPLTYGGLNEALEVVQSTIINDTDPREPVALLGFSQGAVLAHLVAAIDRDLHPTFQRITHAILSSGFPAAHVPNANSPFRFRSFEDIPLPSLHLIGKKDTSVLPAQSVALANKFRFPKFLYHEKGHIIPQQSALCASIVKFLSSEAEA